MQITRKQLSLAKIWWGSKIVPLDGIDLFWNFQEDLLMTEWVMGPLTNYVIWQTSWPLLLKIDHKGHLQNYANNRKTVGFSYNLVGSKIVQHDQIDLCWNFQKGWLMNELVMGPEIDFFPNFIFPTWKIFSKTTGWIRTKLCLNAM